MPRPDADVTDGPDPAPGPVPAPIPHADPASLPAPPPVTGEDAGVSLMRVTALMSVGTALSRMTGFVRLAVMAWAVGGVESKVPDTYNLANSLPNIVYQLVLGEILATVFVPVFVEYIHKRERDESWRLASSILNLAAVVAAIFAAITMLFAPQIIKIYTFHIHNAGLRHQQEVLGAFFMRLFMPQMIFYAVGAVLTGLLNAHKKFVAPMFAPLLNNGIVIATFIVFRVMHGARPLSTGAVLSTGEKWLLGGGTTLGVIAFTMVLWPFVRKLPGRYSPREFAWRHPAIRHVGNLAKYSFGYVIVNQVGLWIVYALANGEKGGVSAFQNAFILYQLPYGIFAVSVMTALVPTLAEHHVRGDDAAFRRDVSLGLRTTAFVVLPAAAAFVALGLPIISLLLQHGAFTARSAKLYGDTFVLMAIGLAAYAEFQQIMRAFYARQDTRTPWIVNIFAVGFNTAINFPLFWWLGVPGLALAHALSYVLALAIGGAMLRKRLGGLDGRRLAIAHLKIGAASIATAALSWWVARSVGHLVGAGTAAGPSVQGRLVQVAAAVLAGLALYAGLAVLLRMEEFTPLVRMVTGRFGRRAQEARP